jgi:hypothetical protein
MNAKYVGGNNINDEERSRLNVELSIEELHSFIKKLYYAKNGFSVAFSVIFNFLAGNNPTKEDGYASVDAFAEEMKRAMDRYYNGELEKDNTLVDGIRVTQIRSAEKLH